MLVSDSHWPRVLTCPYEGEGPVSLGYETETSRSLIA